MDLTIDNGESRAPLRGGHMGDQGNQGLGDSDTRAASTPSDNTQSRAFTDHHIETEAERLKQQVLEHQRHNHPTLRSIASASASEAGLVSSTLDHIQHGSENQYPLLPPPSQDRRDASLNEKPLELGNLSSLTSESLREKEKTFLYLAYGSNLCIETFRGVRGIRPLSQINVVVPTLRLTFDLPGMPYVEPCFANCALRDPNAFQQPPRHPIWNTEYHKNRWLKGMVGCVYEVTAADYAHIIATEGGGASYRDIVVECYPLDTTGHNHIVPLDPKTKPFKAHTLFSPVADPATRDRISRPDPSYAQPSARYLKLLTDGASELNLPYEYRRYLNDIRPYTITTRRQQLGKWLFMLLLGPLIFFLFALQRRFQDRNGRSPKWILAMVHVLFLSIWTSYDAFMKKVFGDGERTEGLDEDEARKPVEWLTVGTHERAGEYCGSREETEDGFTNGGARSRSRGVRTPREEDGLLLG